MNWIDLKNKSGKLFYSILYHNISQEIVITNLKKYIEKINKLMKDPYKKKLANDRLYLLQTTIETSWKKQDIINCLFLISDTKIDFFHLNKKEQNIVNTWNIPKELTLKGKDYNIDYFVDLFDDIHFYHLFHYHDNILKYYHIGNNKIKLVNTNKLSSTNLEEELKESCKITSNCKYNQTILHGTGTILKKIELPDIKIFNKYIDNDKLLEEFYQMRMKLIHLQFEETIGYISHPEKSKLLIFGTKEITTSINDYMIKTLFITPKKLKILKENISSDYLNFEIIELARIEKGDIFDTFVKDYSGLLGVLYYSV